MGSLVGSTAGASHNLKPPTLPPFHWRQLSVLVVDDHSAYRLLLGGLLQKLGLGHETAADGYLGLVAFTTRPFDLVISDCQMPFMDGYSMARAIRQHECDTGMRRVPIIALTANLQNDSPKRCRDAGMDAWLLKPLTLEQLHAVLVRWLPGVDDRYVEQAAIVPLAGWPTRATLVATFGSEPVVDQLLETLLFEAWEDHRLLRHACATLNASLTAERLHRLVGSLVFLGGTGLEPMAVRLIEQVRSQGVAAHKVQLELFLARLYVYLEYLSDV
ncbi:response regulator [Pseudomonas edaphica]|uniref:Response regulator n=2 Tax=Gammaproteobacteria TaxID=1236 RepID=A0A5R8QUA3_9PSED|nr:MULTISPECIES: response regulator [Pseudomonas]MCF5139793.1 response regulator [Pseudomonas sp. PA-6-3C]MCF5148093.1 response regulator [Pseudomonas sp. PA-6-3F]MCF5158984.1 response regulator [Pseudomonas sp. PA-6-2E]MCF5177614.1 response regulator [Pseudomonas sp. PA-6-1D]MCF5195857.1 response regulator [Pseudomonas sp. PA-6-1H]